MCWFVKINIDYINAKRSLDLNNSGLDFGSFCLEEKNGGYLITDNGCLCEYFGQSTTSRLPLCELITQILENDKVKRISVTKFWADNNQIVNVETIEKEDLKAFILEDQLEEKTSYKIVDTDKFSYNYQLRTTNYELPTTNYQLQTTNYKLNQPTPPLHAASFQKALCRGIGLSNRVRCTTKASE